MCTCRHSEAQEVHNGGFESERDFTLKAARSLLFIEVDECRVVAKAHVFGGYEIISITACEIFAGT